MQIGFSNYKKVLAATVIKEGEKLLKSSAVRELDEVSKGCFVAYVDEGDESWDVRLVLNEKEELTEYFCDCDSDYFFCAHRVAVFLHLKDKGTTTGGKSLLKKMTKKKKGISLDGIQPEALEEWLLSVFKTHKYLQEEFLQKFRTQELEFTEEMIQKQLQTYSKSVLGNKRNMDSSMFKKLLALRMPYLKQIVEKLDYLNAPEQAINFAAQIFIHQTNIIQRTSFKSKKLNESWTEIIALVTVPLLQLENKENWNGFFAALRERFQSGNSPYHLAIWVDLLLSSLNDTKPQIRTHICKFIDECWSKKILQKIYDQGALMKKILKVIVQGLKEAEIFLPKLAPIGWELEYNLDLIEILSNRGDLATVQKFCNICIRNNVNPVYNLPYLQILENLYRNDNNTPALKVVLQDILWLEPGIELYKEWTELVKEPEEIKQFRNKLFAKARSIDYQNMRFRLFWIELLLFEGKIDKVFTDLKTRCLVWDLMVSLSVLYKNDANKTLFLILNALSASMVSSNVEEEEEVIVVNKLIEEVEKLYSEQMIQSYVETLKKDHRYFSTFHKPILKYFTKKYNM